MAEQGGSDVGKLTITVSADVEDAVAGLKAVQREARKTTQALREVESSSAREIDRLADFIMREIPGEPSRSESAVDVAIRLLSKSDLSRVTVCDLRTESLKQSLKDGDRAAQDALALIEEQEKMIAELERGHFSNASTAVLADELARREGR